MAWKYIKVSRGHSVTTITMNRPEVMNALHKGMVAEMDMVISVVSSMSGTNAVVITGAEDRAFSTGADINELAAMTPEDFEAWLKLNQSFFHTLAALPMPVIAALNGYTLGGGLELALACDLRVARAGIKLGFPEVRLGLIPGTGGTQRLTRLVGPGVANDLILTGRRITAEEALSLGLVNLVVPAEAWPQGLNDYVAEITQRAPLAVRGAKKCIAAAIESSLEEGLELERTVNMQCFGSQDFKEGIAAFQEKRPPNFHGN